MDTSQIGIIALIAANVLFSLKGLNDRGFFAANLFSVGQILQHKQYKRLLSSGFLHVSWVHLFFNMFTLYSFGKLLLELVGPVQFFIIYFVSLVGGNVLSLLLNRHKSYYTAVGASGAVSGVLFACIAVYPQIGVSLFFIPIFIPGWLFGILFILISVYGMHKGTDNIGHDAHLGGALIGLITTVLFYPALLFAEPLILAAMFVPALVFLLYLAKKPPQPNWLKQREHLPTPTPKKPEPHSQQPEIDRILDKANTQGWETLTPAEIATLQDFAERNKL